MAPGTNVAPTPHTSSPMTSWMITYLPGARSPGGQETETVQAAYVVCPEKLRGWTVLKDTGGNIVKMVRDNVVASIDRAPAPA